MLVGGTAGATGEQALNKKPGKGVRRGADLHLQAIETAQRACSRRVSGEWMASCRI